MSRPLFRSIFMSCLLAACADSAHKSLPHLDPEMSGAEYARLLTIQMSPRAKSMPDPLIEEILRYGTRNLEWLRQLNERRPASERVYLTSPEDARGHPIESPVFYGPAALAQELASFRNEVPAALGTVWLQDVPYPDTIPGDVASYRAWARRLDKLYQYAARWRLLEPYREGLAWRRFRDVRGIYFLSRTPDLETKLRDWAQLAPEDQLRYRGWLLGVCLNHEEDVALCERRLGEALASHQLWSFYTHYRPAAEEVYADYFRVDGDRRRLDLSWSAEGARLPFDASASESIRNFVRAQIEDEFRWAQWGLKLDFSGTRPQNPYVDFLPGVTPHVEGLGASRIVMDLNQDLAEPEAQWIFRHEFGHVLGLPDCYVEFYEPERQVMVSYQIDTSDLMCSRRGRMNERIFLDLKRAYAN